MPRARVGRPLTPGEIAMAKPLFGEAIRWEAVRLHRRRWWPLQPRDTIMAPDGHIWFSPGCAAWRDDFADAPLSLQHLFMHELTHVWQVHTRGRWWLLLHRHPLCRYRYTLRPGWPLARYGVEQQAEIVADAWAWSRADGGAKETPAYPPLPADTASLKAAAGVRGSDRRASDRG